LKDLEYSKRYVSGLFLIDKQIGQQIGKKDLGILRRRDAFCTQYNASSLVSYLIDRKNLRILRRRDAFCTQYNAPSLVSYLAKATIFEGEDSVTILGVAGFPKHRPRLNWD